MDDRKPGATAERRREDRIELFGGEIALCQADGNVSGVPVITYDMSRSGMAVVCGSELESGTLVYLKGDGVGNGTLRATVRWCRRVDDGVYKAGLLFS